MSVMLYPCILCVALLMDLFVLCVVHLTVFVNCLVKQFAICLGVVVIFLLSVMKVFSVGGGALLDRLCMIFPKKVRVEPVIPVCIYVFLPYVLFMF